jgi:CO/xanthine dehydrogenase Mo-binding subunit
MSATKILGKRTTAVGSHDIVTGQARYTPDLTFPGMLVGKLLYTTHPSARIVNIDVSKARALPGVAAVITHEDIPGENSYLVYDSDQPLLIEDYARYQGDALAAIAAENEAAAQAALQAIEVDYEPLPGIFSPLEAMKPESPRVWPDRDNIYGHVVIDGGDVSAAFEQADIIVENTYTTQTVEHAYLEPEGAVALVESDGMVVVYTSCQTPHRDRTQIARSLGIPESMVRVIVPRVGGAFGGKDEAHVQIHIALLAQATRRPVRLIRSREESILTHVKRHPVTIRYRSAVTTDGQLLGVDVQAIGDTGPYANMGMNVMSVLASHVTGAYYVPNSHIESYTVLTNNPICGAMRGFGQYQAHFACERQMDAIAQAVGVDPVEIRLRNALQEGMKLPTGAKVRQGSSPTESIGEAVRLSGWKERDQSDDRLPAHLRRGWGIAAMLESFGIGRNLPDYAGAVLEMAVDGSVILRTGAVDMGQGAYTVLAQLAAEQLGVELSAVRVITPDTDKTVEAGASCASRVTFTSGNAILRSALPIRRGLLKTAAEETGIPEEKLSLRGGFLFAEEEKLAISVAELAQKARQRNHQLNSSGYYAMDYPDDIFDEDSYPHAPGFFTAGAAVARVLVDLETGEVTVEELVLVQDIGRVLNPDGALGQAEGGMAMGLGGAILEELIVREGKTLNYSLESYLIPTVRDIPKTIVKFLETPEPYGPYGARGMAEGPIILAPPAIVNAISDAIGAPLNSMPVTAERVLEALEGNGNTS